jgi:aminomuconate-semialdehyde/2-hydroxymuconate-6-semialdehyde dehydrogenase
LTSQLLKSIAPTRHFIGGQPTGSHDHRQFTNLNPATDETLSEVSLGGEREVADAVQACRSGLEKSGWASWELPRRAEVLRHLADLLNEYRREIAEIESMDTGKPIAETFEGDVPRAMRNLCFFADFAERQPLDFYRGDDGSVHRTGRTPLGIVGLITPWNLPLYLETWKLAPALMQGNAVILKPAELTPMSATLLAQLAHQAGVPAGVFNVVHGFGAQSAGQALVEHPEVRAISFTGETTTGTAIMRSAAPHLKKLSFELGGKGASVIFADADLDAAVPTACRAAFRNQGQICLAGSRILVEDAVFDEVVQRLLKAVAQIQVGDPLRAETTMGSLIGREHRDKVEGYITWAREQGLNLATGGKRPSGLENRGAFFAPTVVVDVAQDSRLVQEEVFGPVVTVQRFRSDQQALEQLNGTSYGLSCSIWTKNRERVARLAPQVRMGLVWVNSWFLRDLHTAFGGMKRSGIGREGGRYSLDFFSELQTISYPAEYQSWSE